MKFRTTILQGGKTATGIEVPPEVVAALSTSRKPAVKVTLNGYTYRSTLATMDGKFMVGVSADVREHAGVKGGDTVEVTLELDTEKREVAVPLDLAAALAKDAKAKRSFEALSYSNQRRYAELITGAKTEETRQRRVAKTVSELREMPAKK
jgi:hypothetical protein